MKRGQIKRGQNALIPDYPEWFKKTTWNELETTLLLMGIDPALLNLSACEKYYKNGRPSFEDIGTDNYELISAFAGKNENLEYSLTDYCANNEFEWMIQVISNMIVNAYCAGEFDEEPYANMEPSSLNPYKICQWAYDNSYASRLILHTELKQHFLHWEGKPLRYSPGTDGYALNGIIGLMYLIYFCAIGHGGAYQDARYIYPSLMCFVIFFGKSYEMQKARGEVALTALGPLLVACFTGLSVFYFWINYR